MLDVKLTQDWYTNNIIAGAVLVNNQDNGTYYVTKRGSNCPRYCTFEQLMGTLNREMANDNAARGLK